MASSSYSPHTGSAKPYSPSAPPAPDPDSDQPRVAYPHNHPNQPPTTTVSSPYAPIAHSQTSSVSSPYAPIAYAHQTTVASFSSGSNLPPHVYGLGSGYGYGYQPYQQQQHQNLYPSFPLGTHPDVIRSFQMVDRNQNGYIEERELREALTWNYQKFGVGTLRLLIYLFRNPNESSARIGPKEFSEIWSCLGQWRVIFERFDRDRSGKIDAVELRDALYSLGYALPPSVLQVLISRYDDGSGRRVELSFDSFVECGMIVKGLTEKFKEKDSRYTGSATLSYDAFLSMIIPFIVSD